MEWTSLYFKTDDLKVLILGTGEVATRRANRFLDKNAKVILVGNSISNDLIKKGAILKSESDIDNLIEWSDLVIIATGNINLANYVTDIAGKKLVNRADNPELANVIVPSTFNIDDVEISIFTNGQSPLIAKKLRKKIQSIISPEDILEMKIQSYARELLKDKVDNQRKRKDYLYSFSDNQNIKNFIKNNDLDGAKTYLKEVIDNI